MTTTLPAARAAFVDGSRRPTPEFYRFLQNLKRVQDGSASDDEVAQLEQDIKTIALALGSPTGDVSDIPPFSNGNPTLQVNFPIGMQGLLQNGFAILSWLGTTTDVPEGENLYFTDARAQTAAVDNAITPGVTNKAPSEHAVAQALADLSPGVPYFIPDGETYKVADDIQALFLESIELDGDSSLEIDGHLEDANVPDTFGKTYQAGTGISIANPTTATPTISSTLGSIALSGRKEDYAHLPTGLGTADAGQAYLVDADGLIYIWDGSAWPAEGQGITSGGMTNATSQAGVFASIAMPTTISDFMATVGSDGKTYLIPAIRVRPSFAYDAAILADAPYAYYPLDALSHGMDIAGNHRDGIVHGGLTFSAPALVAGTEQPSVADFDGSNDYVDISAAAGGLVESYSYETWLDTSVANNFMDVNSSASGGNEVYTSASAMSFFQLQNTSKGSVSFGGSLSGARHHVVVTADKATNTFTSYVDGAQTDQAVITGVSWPTAAAQVLVGHDMYQGSHYGYINGSISNVAVYDKVLTAAQVLAHYNAGA